MVARLFGAVEALREAINAPLPAGEQAEYERAVEAVRMHLGSEIYEVLRTNGGMMPLEQAITEALNEFGIIASSFQAAVHT